MSNQSENELTYPKNPTWCPGCGNLGIWGALKKGISDTKRNQDEVCLVYDIGCAGNSADFNNYYGMHSLHGRALPTAVGVKLGNHKLTVIAVVGDGGCYGEGGTHFLNDMRGNHDITLIVHNNHRYSLTTGQASPTTDKGVVTKSTPEGVIEKPFNAISVALVNHATFIAREFAGDIPRMANRISEAINHPGFAFIEILQPCPSFNPDQGYEWYRERIEKLEDLGHDSSDRTAALSQAMKESKLPIGVFFKVIEPVYHEQTKALQSDTLVNKFRTSIDLEPFFAELR